MGKCRKKGTLSQSSVSSSDENETLCSGSYCSLVETIKAVTERFPQKMKVDMELTVNITGDGVELFEEGYFTLIFGVKLPNFTGSKIHALVLY